MENLPNSIDLSEWDKALRACKTMLDPSEQDWASLKCAGGPHEHPNDQTEPTPTRNQATSIKLTRIIDLTD